MRILAELRRLDFKIDKIMESIAKYVNEETDYFVVKSKKKIVENLLRESNLSLDSIAKMVGVTIDFVINIKQKISLE